MKNGMKIMYARRRWTLLVFLTAAIGLSSCEALTEVSKIKDGTDGTGTGTLHPSNNGLSNQTVNNWIYDNMNAYYLWGDKMPSKANSSLGKVPDEYFGSLLYQYGTVDRFSWIEEDAEELLKSLQGVTKSSGFSYTPFLAGANTKDVIFAVRYSIKDSPAANAGLTRGDIISKVNGVTIDTLNYRTILASDNLVFTLAERSGGSFVPTGKTISVTKQVIQNFPVQFYKIIESGDKKIGYLVYTQFIPGITTNGATNAQFDNELRALFGEFKAQGVSELVLDLRYNGGGYISSSDVLSALIVKNLRPGTLMSKQIWSDNARKIFNDPESAYESYWRSEANNLGNLNRVFILTSGSTASASELVINNLKPFMEVVLVGGNTYGKDVGSVTIDDSRNNYRWKWGLQPIVLRTVNALGEANYGTKSGFTPDYPVNDNILPYQPFGDPSETLLKVVLEKITGTSSVASARAAATLALPALEKGGGFDNPRNNIRDMYLESPRK